MQEKTVLAIDPGSSKCGLAIVRREGDAHISLLWRRIEPRESLLDAIREGVYEHPVSLTIVGGGTQSRSVVGEVRSLFPSMGVLVVDEKNTTLEARERYWEYNPRRGWRRLVPATLQAPPDQVDDFVALILAERVLLEG